MDLESIEEQEIKINNLFSFTGVAPAGSIKFQFEASLFINTNQT